MNSQALVQSTLNVRAAVWLFGKVCLVAAVAFAHFTGIQLLRARKQEIPTISIAGSSESKTIRAPVSEDAYGALVQSTIFGKPEAPAPAPQPEKATELKLRLVGTNISSGGRSYAIIEETAKHEQDIFGVDESVFDQAKLVALFPDKVLLKRSGSNETETLLLEDGADSGGGGEDGPREGQTDFTVSENELNEELANLPRLLSQARAVPYFRGGQSVGMRLFAIRRGSLYEKLGLKNGDILKAVNDNSLSDPTQALKLFEQLKSERSIYLTVERNGEDVDLKYAIE